MNTPSAGPSNRAARRPHPPVDINHIEVDQPQSRFLGSPLAI